VAAIAAVVAMIVVVGCVSKPDAISPILRMDYVNNTDSRFCVYLTPVDPRTSCPTLEPNTSVVNTQDCYTSAWIYLVDEAAREEIYGREARCEEWFEAGHTITVDREGDTLVITDGFPDPPGDP
jgi:hypothetical protein